MIANEGWRDIRELPRAGKTRRGGDGGSVPRAGRGVAARCSDQGVVVADDRGEIGAGVATGGGACGVRTEPPEHLHDLSSWRSGWRVVHRDGIDRRQTLERAD